MTIASQLRLLWLLFLLLPLPSFGRTAQPKASAPPAEPKASPDRNFWEEIRKKGIAAILIGEPHHDPEMIAAEKRFLQSAFAHGARALVVEYPKAHQRELDNWLRNPTHEKLARAVAALLTPEQLGKTPQERASALAAIRARHEAVDRKDPEKIQALHLSREEIAGASATVERYHLWEQASRIGYRILAGDLGPERGVDAKGDRVARPSVEETARYRWGPYGMRERNDALAAEIAAAPHGSGPVIAIVGSAHTGFLPEERLRPAASPQETYPGLNYLLYERFGLRSLAVVRSRVSSQGWLAEIALGFLRPGTPREALNRHTELMLSQDPFRVFADEPASSLESALPAALDKQKEALPLVVQQPAPPQPQPGVLFNRR